MCCQKMGKSVRGTDDISVFVNDKNAKRQALLDEKMKEISYENIYLKHTLIRPQLVFLIALFAWAIIRQDNYETNTIIINVVSLFSLIILYEDKRNWVNEEHSK